MITNHVGFYHKGTSAERAALSPQISSVFYDTDLSQWFIWDGSAWGPFDIATWLGLSDTDTDYVGHAGNVPMVNVGENGLELTYLGDLLDTEIQPGCRIYNNASITLANWATWESLTFNSESFDVMDMHDPGVNPSRITIPEGEGGVYLVGGTIQFNTDGIPGDKGYYGVRILLNGADVLGWFLTEEELGDAPSGPYDTALPPINVVISLSAGDYLELQAFSDHAIEAAQAKVVEYVAPSSPGFWATRIDWRGTTAEGATTWAELTDTAGSLVGQGGKLPRVNDAGTTLELVATLPVSILADYARGSIFRGGAAAWEAYAAETDGAALVGDGTDIISDLTPTWKGLHTFENAIVLSGTVNPLISLLPAHTDTACIINVTPSAVLSNIGAHWEGMCINGAALDPSVVDVDIHGIHIDLSGVLTTNLPHLDGLFIETPADYHGGEKNHGIHLTGGGIRQDWDGSSITIVDLFTVHDVVIDIGAATAGDIHAYDVAIAGTGSVPVNALGTHSGVGVIHQHIGVFAATAKAWDENGGFTDITAKLIAAGGGDDVVLFSADDDYLYISGTGVATAFDEVQVILAVAADKSIKPIFEFSTGVPGWTEFFPSDDTLGFQVDGTIRFESANLITAGWAVQDVNAEGQTRFWIRIQRTRNNMTSPTESTIKVLLATPYWWDEDGDVSIHDLAVADALTLVNAINEFSKDGTLGGNSDDAVPTEKAVKAYVDAVGSGIEIQEDDGKVADVTVLNFEGGGGLLTDEGGGKVTVDITGGGGGAALPRGHIVGLEVACAHDEQVTIDPGECRDVADSYDFKSTAVLTIDVTGVGANGIDAGVAGADTFYSIWIIAKADDTIAGMASLSVDAPTMPADYVKKRRLGWALTDGTSDFYQQGMVAGQGNSRLVDYLVNDTLAPFKILNVANIATAPAWTDVDCSAVVPSTATHVTLHFYSVTASGPVAIAYRPKNHATYLRNLFAGTVSFMTNTVQILPLDGDRIGQVQGSAVDEDLNLLAPGYYDNLLPDMT